MSLSWYRPFWVICRGQCGARNAGAGNWLRVVVEVGEDASSSSPQENIWKDPFPPKRGFLKWWWPGSVVVSVPPSHDSRINVHCRMSVSKSYSMFLSLKKKVKLTIFKITWLFKDLWISPCSVYSLSSLVPSVRHAHIWQTNQEIAIRFKGAKGFVVKQHNVDHFAENFCRGRLSHNATLNHKNAGFTN